MRNLQIKTGLCAAVLMAFNTAPVSAVQEEAPDAFIYANYFTCNGSLAAVDKVVDEELAPIYDAAVEDGTITQWGWAMHHTGGKWSRLMTIGSDSVEGLFAAQTTMTERTADTDPDNTFNKVCSAHDDYIWQVDQVSVADGEPGQSSLSTYLKCDVTTEEGASQAFTDHVAPAFQAQIDAGTLTGYGLYNHIYGGEYRKIMTLTGKSFSDVSMGHSAALASLFGDGENEDAMAFFKACGEHADYLWYWKH